MTTQLNKRVRRQTTHKFPENGNYGRVRSIVIELTPNNLIGLRFSGKRTTYYVDASVLLLELMWKEAKLIAKTKRDLRKKKRSL